MPVHEAEAIVLRQYSLADSDRIIVFITKEYGKIRATAKGVKKLNNPLMGCLESLNHIRLEFYIREGRDLGQIRRAELIRSYLGSNPDLNQIYAFIYFSEIVNEVVQDNQPNHHLFRLLLASLEAGTNLSISPALIRYFEIWCLKLSGLFPNYDYCSRCGKCVKDDVFFAWMESGQSRCSACAQGRGLKIGISASVALSAIAKLTPERFAAFPLAEDAAEQLERLSQRLINLHLERKLKSYPILRNSLQGL